MQLQSLGGHKIIELSKKLSWLKMPAVHACVFTMPVTISLTLSILVPLVTATSSVSADTHIAIHTDRDPLIDTHPETHRHTRTETNNQAL